MWSVGKIVKVMGAGETNLGDKDGKNVGAFEVAYVKDQALPHQFHAANAQAIAPPGTHTAGESWRDNLKEGDRVDVLDKANKWVTATVV